MDYFARQNMIISTETAQYIRDIRVLCIGAGAGGNEVLKNLVLMGFGHITIVDFDSVEDSNLSRTVLFRKEDIGRSKALAAAERLKEMALHDSPEITGLHGNIMTDFGKGLFIEHDIVLCCVDTIRARVYINDWCVRTKTPFFEMGFADYTVDVSFFSPLGKYPDLEEDFPVCLRDDMGYANISDPTNDRRNSCSNFKVHDTELAKIPTIQVSAAMAGTLMATELVKFLSNMDTIRNKMLMFYGRTCETQLLNLARNPECEIHKEKMPIMEVAASTDMTIGDLLTMLKEQTKMIPLLHLPDEFVLSGTCQSCGATVEYNMRRREIWDEQRWCDSCKNSYPDYENRLEFGLNLSVIPQEVSLDMDGDILQRKLKDVGVPENDILELTLIDSENNYQSIFIYLKNKQL